MNTESVLFNRTVFILLVLLYLVNLLLDAMFLPPLNAYVKFLYVCTCFVYANVAADNNPAPLKLALAITILCDYFLLFTDYYSLGISLFILVQWAHAVRFAPNDAYKTCCVFGSLVFLLVIVNTVIPAHNLYWMAAAYACCLLYAIKKSGENSFPPLQSYFARLGMIFFLLCDIHVALYYVLPATHFYKNPAGFFMWFFYMPSQLLLVLSGIQWHPAFSKLD